MEVLVSKRTVAGAQRSAEIKSSARSCRAPRKFYSEYSSDTFVVFCCDIVKISGANRYPFLRFLFIWDTHKSIFAPSPMSQLKGERIQNRSCPDVQNPNVSLVDPDAARRARLVTAAPPRRHSPRFPRAGATPATPSTPNKRGNVDE